MEEKPQTSNETEPDNKDKDKEIFEVEEIQIEEMAIDGICGVY